MPLSTKSVKLIDVHDLEDLIRRTYERPYSIIACGINGSTGRDDEGNHQETMLQITIPAEAEWYEDLEHAEGVDLISYNPRIEGDPWVRPTFEEWRDQPYPELNERQRDPSRHTYMRDHRLEREYCCSLQPVVNDLHARGEIEAGEYVIRIWW